MSYYGGGAFRALGQGVRGIGYGVADRRREEDELARRDLEDERRREREDAEMGAWRAGQDAWLAEMGGAPGPPPTVERELPGTGAPLPEPDFGEGLFDPPDDRVGAAADTILGEAPTFERRTEPIRLPEPDDRYMEVGEGFGHIERPDLRRARLAEEDFERSMAHADRVGDRLAGRIGSGLGDIASGRVGRAHDDFGPTAANLIGEGVDPLQYMPWDMNDPATLPAAVRSSQWYLDRGYGPRGEILGEGGQPVRAGGAGQDRGVPSYPQAMQTLQNMYAITDDDGYVVGYSLPMPEMHRLAQEMARGEEVAFPGQGGDAPPSRMGPAFGGATDPFASFREPETTLPEPSIGPTREAAGETGDERQVISRDQAEYLREVQGMSDDEIRRLYIVEGG